MREREISLVNLFVEILLHWRTLILAVVIGMALMGGFSYLQSARASEVLEAEISKAKVQVEELNEKLNAGGEITADEQKELEDLQKKIQTGNTVIIGVDMKNIAIGAVIAIMAYTFIYMIIKICDPHICVTDEFEELFSVAQLGLISRERKSTKFLGIIDDTIIRLCKYDNRRPKEVRALQLAYVSVGLVAEKNGLDTVHFVGCDIKGHTAYVCEQLKQALEKKDIHVEVLSNVLYNPESMSKLERAQGVVLVEKAGVAKNKEIQREIELMNRLNIPVWGGIIVQ